MKDTSNFRTKTSFITRNNGHIPGVWEIGIDYGYSAVKVFSPNSISRFPSYAMRVKADFSFIGETSKNSILYKDLETNEMWLVGEVAENIKKTGDTTDSESTLYGRDRWNNPMSRVLIETGLGLAMNRIELKSSDGSSYVLEPGNDKIVIQTGLPEEYMDDAEDVKDAFSGKHAFALKIADNEWKNYTFEVSSDDVYVMSQPKGTLFSVCINKNGQFHPDARKYLQSSVIVFDAGFGTLDIFTIDSGTVGEGETYRDLGMKRILQETSQGIKNAFNVDIPVPAMQKALATGKVRHFDKKNFKATEYNFGDILAAANTRICDEAITRTASALNLIDYNYLIITGGTGAAWYNQIVEKFKDFDTLEIIKGSQNDDLPFVYSNVRGYYFYRFNKLGAAK